MNKPIRIGILTVSDRSARGEREDASGPALEKVAAARGWVVQEKLIIPDDRDEIYDTLERWADESRLDLILTTGGTGFAERDVTPDATLEVINRLAPGLAEAMRAASMSATPHAMLSRAVAGIRGQTLIVNLPGSPRGAVENLQVILTAIPHAVQILRGEPGSEMGHRTSAA
jgi:molybdenum cofactor synthesis domain-containing protein